MTLTTILLIITVLILALAVYYLRQIAALLEKMGDILTDQLSAVLDEMRKK